MRICVVVKRMHKRFVEQSVKSKIVDFLLNACLLQFSRYKADGAFKSSRNSVEGYCFVLF